MVRSEYKQSGRGLGLNLVSEKQKLRLLKKIEETTKHFMNFINLLINLLINA